MVGVRKYIYVCVYVYEYIQFTGLDICASERVLPCTLIASASSDDNAPLYVYVCVCACVCVCEREREREREHICVSVCKYIFEYANIYTLQNACCLAP